jgi:hypothetical protein
MGYSSPLLMPPESTPIRPEVVEASTPWSDILLEELRTVTRFDPLIPTSRYGVANRRNVGMCLRSQSKILWLAILVIAGLLWGHRAGKKAFSYESKLVAQPKLDGLQFLDANHPSIRVRWLDNLIELLLTLDGSTLVAGCQLQMGRIRTVRSLVPNLFLSSLYSAKSRRRSVFRLCL